MQLLVIAAIVCAAAAKPAPAPVGLWGDYSLGAPAPWGASVGVVAQPVVHAASAVVAQPVVHAPVYAKPAATSYASFQQVVNPVAVAHAPVAVAHAPVVHAAPVAYQSVAHAPIYSSYGHGW